MFILIRKKIIKRYLVLALGLIFLGRSLIFAAPVMAMDEPLIPNIILESELRAEGFTDAELKQMGFVSGIGKVIVYNAKQKQIWNQRVEKARERVEVSRISGKKPNPRDLYLLERDNEIKNPPKKGFVEKWFGQTAAQMIEYYKGGKGPDAKILGEGLTLTGLLLLLKALAPALAL